MKKVLLLTLLLFSVVLLSGCVPKKTATVEKTPLPQPTLFSKPTDEVVTQKPYLSLIPTGDGHWVTLEVKNVGKEFKKLEYDLVYLADAEESQIERGVSTGGNPVELGSDGGYSKKILFGSASCTTGVCKYKYDENVTEGTVSLTLIGNSRQKLESVYRIQKGFEAKEGLTAGDGVFSFVSTALPSRAFYLTISTLGIPVALPAEVIPKTAPYAIFPAITAAGKVSFKTTVKEGFVYGFNGKSWQRLSTVFAAGEAKAESSGNYLFVLAR